MRRILLARLLLLWMVLVRPRTGQGMGGKIKVFGVSPRDGTTPTYYYFITVRFA